MAGLVIDHLWQSTVVALAAGGLALVLRRYGARWRYWIWFAASMKFLIPFALLTAFGAQFAWRQAPPDAGGNDWRTVAPVEPDDSAATPPLTDAVAAGSLPTAAPTQEPAHDPALESGSASPARFIPPLRLLAGAALAIWLLGSGFVALRWLRRWQMLERLARNGRKLAIGSAAGAGIEIRVTSSMIEPGIFGIVRPVLLIPEGMAERLSAAQLDTIVSHERIHVERRDNLTAALHMLVEVLFWFHPLVWWIGARLIDERERACDEAVLAAGADPDSYASGLLAVCGFYLESPLRCASGVGGGSLGERVTSIAENRRSRALGRVGAWALSGLSIAGVLVPVAVGLMDVRVASAQQPVQPVVGPVAEPAVEPSTEPAEPAAPDPSDPWYPLAGPPPLVDGFGNGSGGSRFNMSLLTCLVRDDAGRVGEVGPLPAINGWKGLVEFAYELEPGELSWPSGLVTPGLRVGQTVIDGEFRIAECRTKVRDALENGYALRMHREGERYVVDSIEVPEVPTPLQQRNLPPLVLPAATLDRYVGYYFGLPEPRGRDSAPVFEVRRDGEQLVLESSGRRFPLLPNNETSFSTNGRFGRQTGVGAQVSVEFTEGAAGSMFASARSAYGDPPNRLAQRVDASLAQAWLADIERRAAGTLPMSGGRELVDELVSRLLSGDFAGESFAAEAARSLREQLDAFRPGVLEGRGELRSVALREVQVAGRDLFDVEFDRLRLGLTIVAGAERTPVALTVDAYCPFNDALEPGRMAPCAVPVAATRVQMPELTGPIWRLASRETELLGRFSAGGSATGELYFVGHNLSFRGCEAFALPPDGVLAPGFGALPEFRRISELIGYAFDLDPYEIQWPDDLEDSLASGSIHVPAIRSPVARHEQCRAQVRQALAREASFSGHFERAAAAVWYLVASEDGPSLQAPSLQRTPRIWGGSTAIEGTNSGMPALAEYLRTRLGVLIVDRTGIADTFDIALRWNTSSLQGSVEEREFAGVRAGLEGGGLLLVPELREVETLVVDGLTLPPLPDFEIPVPR